MEFVCFSLVPLLKTSKNSWKAECWQTCLIALYACCPDIIWDNFQKSFLAWWLAAVVQVEANSATAPTTMTASRTPCLPMRNQEKSRSLICQAISTTCFLCVLLPPGMHIACHSPLDSFGQNNLGKPSFQKSAVFFNIVQKAFDPPPFYLNICPILQGVFFNVFWNGYEIYVAPHI